ncbi:MAG: DMT family transporter [Candidatus Diapherotrites archaeon]|nr:DMT family transporter [Candidatus Diapherotrites archaeon]
MANALRAVIAQLSAMKSYLALGIGSMGIATVGILVKFIGKDANFMTIMFYRVFFGAIFLLATVPFMDKKAFTLTKKDLRDYFFVGTLWTIGAITYVWAFQFAPVQNVVLLHSIYPFFVFILAGPLLGERITRTKVISAAIGLVGLVILNPLYPGEYAFGNLMAIISAVLWALIVVEMKKKNKGHDIGNVMWQFVFAAIVMLPTPFFFGLGNWAASWPLFLAIGAVSTGAAYIFYNYGLQRIEAQESSIIMTIINPVFSILLAAVLLSETVEIHYT